MGGILGKILGGGLSEVLKSAGDIVDNVVTNKEEAIKAKTELEKVVNDHIEKMATLVNEQEENYLKDVASAREMNIKIQEASTSSWLSKNISYFIDILVTIVWCGITLYLVGRALNLISTTNVDLTGVLSIYATVTAVFSTILNYHRGSSRQSAMKDETIKGLASGSSTPK